MKIMIAGASGGIGNYLSKKFDSERNELYLTYNTSKNKICKTEYALSHVLKCNFTKKEEVEKIFENIPSLDVLINVMGHFENCLIYQMDEGEWDRVIASNLKTVFLSCRFAIEKMVDYGHIINISSVLGSTGMIGASNYVATKGAVEAFSRSFALECLHNRRVFVNSVALGYFKIGMGLQLDEKIKTIVKEKIPLKDFGDPDEIFKVIQYIISSKYLVGQVIHINGGLKL